MEENRQSTAKGVWKAGLYLTPFVYAAALIVWGNSLSARSVILGGAVVVSLFLIAGVLKVREMGGASQLSHYVHAHLVSSIIGIVFLCTVIVGTGVYLAVRPPRVNAKGGVAQVPDTGQNAPTPGNQPPPPTPSPNKSGVEQNQSDRSTTKKQTASAAPRDGSTSATQSGTGNKQTVQGGTGNQQTTIGGSVDQSGNGCQQQIVGGNNNSINCPVEPLPDSQLEMLAARPGGLIYGITVEVSNGSTGIVDDNACATIADAHIKVSGGSTGIRSNPVGTCLWHLDPNTDRRITAENEKILIPYLSAHTASVMVESIKDDKEAKQFAADWYLAFQKAGWTTVTNHPVAPLGDVGIVALLPGKGCIPPDDRTAIGRAMYALSAMMKHTIPVACSEDQDKNLVIVSFGKRH